MFSERALNIRRAAPADRLKRHVARQDCIWPGREPSELTRRGGVGAYALLAGATSTSLGKRQCGVDGATAVSVQQLLSVQ